VTPPEREGPAGPAPRAAVAIVAAAGAGTRMERDRPKAFLVLDGRSLLTMAVEAACACPRIGRVVVAAPPGWEGRAEALLPATGAIRVVTGGATRQESVRLGLDAVAEGADAVVCHDAARALAPPSLFEAVLAALGPDVEAVVPVVEVADTVKRIRDGMVEATVERDGLALAQTPQAFAVAPLREAHERAFREGRAFTDDAALMEWAGHAVRVVLGDPDNFKLTTPEDLARARAVLAARGPEEAPSGERRRG
jgi:2-C-methyl-D-erythritol 4-phosphate cytidylyltransferase / 2-C-methyl-D-erythritol 2,4-cyclodiphosphate synthase